MKLGVAAAVLLGLNSIAANAQDQTYDTRSLAMGGTGVAIANSRNAAFLNPSILASKDEDKFAWDIPIVSARLLDEQKMLTDMDDLKTISDKLTASLTTVQNAINAANYPAAQAAAPAAVSALNNFNNSLNGINGKALNGGAFVGTMFAIPSKNLSFALTADVRAEGGAKFNYATADAATIGNLATALNNCATNQVNCASVTGINPDGTVQNLASNMEVRGVVAKEVAISIAHHFAEWADTDIGITPKFVQLQTVDARFNAQSTSNGIQDSDKNSESLFNFDVGASTSVRKTEDSNVKVGLVVKDMLSKTVKTVLDNDIEIKPRATVGIGYLTKLTSTGIDLDVVSNKPMISGFSQESQFLRLGAEFDAWRWAQIRVGYRHDLKGNYKGLPSIGLGLSPFGVHVDLSVAYASASEAAAALQVGMHF